MCKPGLRVKFCTCGGYADLGYPRWEHWRSVPPGEDVALSAVGSFVYTPPPLDEQLVRDRFLQDLNDAKAFDVDLAPKEGDTFFVHIDEDSVYGFVLRSGEWVEGSWPMPTPATDTPHAAGPVKTVTSTRTGSW